MAAVDAAQQPFNQRTLFWGIFASLFAAAGFFLLSTYAPDYRMGHDGGATPASKSGTGYAGLIDWMALNGDAPQMARTEDELASDALLIVTISPDSDLEALDRIVELRPYQETLFVLPKWRTEPLPTHPGWEAKRGRLDAAEVNAWLGRIAKARIGAGPSLVRQLDICGRIVPAPDDLQWVDEAEPAISAGAGRAVLTNVDDTELYILTDPDLLNNAALKDPRKAAAALALIDMLRPNDDPVMFDLTLHGAGRSYDLAKLLVEPPFLALTLTILVSAALAFLHGLGRFGPPMTEQRAIPFGKRALVDTTAMLLRRAGRLDGLGGRYAAVARGRAGALLGAPHGLQADALDHWLDSRDKKESDGFTKRARAASDARTLSEMHEAARQLHEWTARRMSERR